MLAEKLNLTVVYGQADEHSDTVALCADSGGLSLTGCGMTLRGDFSRLLPRIKVNNLRGELIVRAAKIKCGDNIPTVVDATAGLGEDSFLLAASGFSVRLFEYNPIIAALLDDALHRSENIPELNEITRRMRFSQGDSLTELSRLGYRPDVILLDPMFPARQKSALVKKKFQLLQHLELPCTDETELMNAALSANPRKIVVKRPPNGPYLAGKKPSYSIEGKGIRYDCISL